VSSLGHNPSIVPLFAGMYTLPSHPPISSLFSSPNNPN